MASATSTDKKSHRSKPYPQPPSRPPKATTSRHRTLVFNNSGNTSSTDDDRGQSSANGWITKRDRHMQLINASILDKTTEARSKAMEETRRQKVLRNEQKEKQRINQFLQARLPSQHTDSTTTHEIIVDGLRFQVLNGGSKLARLRGEKQLGNNVLGRCSNRTDTTDVSTSTPKQARVGGVIFIRSRNGNLYRSGIAKAKRYDFAHFDLSRANLSRYIGITRKIKEPCKRFTLTGTLLPLRTRKHPF